MLLPVEERRWRFPSTVGKFLQKLQSPTCRPRFAVEPIPISQASFVSIAPGTFLMGSPEYEPGRNHDEFHHEVTLSRPFFMQSTPVTQRQCKAVMGTEPSSFKDRGADGSVTEEDCPVVGISWHECQVFIQKLNAVGECTYRLPTEAEWEYACRAGTETPLAGGEITELYCRHDPFLDAMGWYCGNAGRRTHPVAGKNANAWGLYDMHGNVSEWCQDWYGDYPPGAQTDPHGPPSGRGRVIRGGSWFSNAKNCRSACRFYWAPNSRSDFIGFRLVKEGK